MRDAIVVGAAVGELIAAHTLARSGFRVRVVSARAVTAEAAHPGWIPERVARALDLERNGLVIERPALWLRVPLGDGRFLDLRGDVEASAAAIREVSPSDAAKWPGFCRRMHALAGILGALYSEPPPDPLAHDFAGLARLAGDALRVRKLGRAGIEDLLRVLPMSIADLLDDWFHSDALKGALGAAGVMHLCQGPRSGGTAFNFLHHHVGSPLGVFRPPRSNALRVLRTLGGVETIASDVERIVVRDGRAAGVVLAGGEELSAAVIVAGLHPSRALLELIDPGRLDPELVRALGNVRSRGVVAEVTLATNRAPGFETLVVAPSLDYLERAYDHAKYGRISEAPYVEARHDAVEGRHRVHVHVQYTPYALRDGAWNAAARESVARVAVETIERHVPGFAASVASSTVLAPPDLESQHGNVQGQHYGADIALDQVLWMRPVPQLARYRTPVEGFYLCGPAMHPGIGAAAGANAASVILKDVRAAKR